MRFKKSVFDWCVENKRFDILDRWDYNANYINPSDISFYSKDYFYLKCLQQILLNNQNLVLNC